MIISILRCNDGASIFYYASLHAINIYLRRTRRRRGKTLFGVVKVACEWFIINSPCVHCNVFGAAASAKLISFSQPQRRFPHGNSMTCAIIIIQMLQTLSRETLAWNTYLGPNSQRIDRGCAQCYWYRVSQCSLRLSIYSRTVIIRL